jgi:hypothetical protein
MNKNLLNNNMGASGIEADVCKDIAERQKKGIAKYGCTVASNPLSLKAWLQHAYEETLDKAVYLKRAIAEMEQETSDLDQVIPTNIHE